MLFGVAVGIIIGLIIGVYLGAQIIDEKNRELKYLRRELARAAFNESEVNLYETYN